MDIHRIIFASSLKPAFDTRTQKLFSSFEDNKKYICHFCGVHSTSANKNQRIHSWKYGRGLTFRLAINIRFFFLLLKIRPQTIILNNNDLVRLSIVYKRLFNKQLIFDMQENTAKNITYQGVYKGFKKQLYLFLTHRANKKIAKHCNGFILAEKCYEQELYFIKNKPFIVLENKALPSTVRQQRVISSPINLLFSGSISEASGIENALVWVDQLNKTTPCHLTVVGHTPSISLHKEMNELNNPLITYKGSLSPISHQLIDQAIGKADFGLVCYQLTEANKNKYPTKLYEYLASQLPIVCQKHKEWNKLIEQSNAGLTFSNELSNVQLEQSFYKQQNTDFAVWGKQKLADWFGNLLHTKN